MFRLILSVFLTLVVSLPLFAQSVDTAWVRRYNGPSNTLDWANDVAVDDSGNVYVTGSGPWQYLTTIKYYAYGDTAWVRSHYYANGTWGRAIAVDHSGNVYVTGEAHGTYWQESITIKYYPDGDTAWLRIYYGPANRGDFSYAIALDDSGNVYVTGYTYSSQAIADYLTIKYYSNGDTAWVRTFDRSGNLNDYASDIAVDDLGNVYVTGGSYGSGTQSDYLTVKYYSNGDTAWARSYNGTGNSSDYARAIAIDNTYNILVTGRSQGSGTFSDYATVKYDNTGNELWVKRYDSPHDSSNEDAQDIAVDDLGNVFVTGKLNVYAETFSSEGSIDLANPLKIENERGSPWPYGDYGTVKYYPNGDTAWARVYDGPGNYQDGANSIAVDDSGNVYVTGFSSQFSSYPGNPGYTTVKYHTDGTTGWVMRYDGAGNDWDEAQAIAVDGSGNVYVTGYSFGDGTDKDYVTIKYAQFLRGDTNGNKDISISDIVYLISYLFKQGPEPEPIQAGDANCDGNLSISDIVYLIAYLFKLGPPPCI